MKKRNSRASRKGNGGGQQSSSELGQLMLPTPSDASDSSPSEKEKLLTETTDKEENTGTSREATGFNFTT
uniref:Uncharacterized protein n=1 Tax=Caenorhabditis japonica TaxID=281687 RepID=A0A8R1ETC0_CAEJA